MFGFIILLYGIVCYAVLRITLAPIISSILVWWWVRRIGENTPEARAAVQATIHAHRIRYIVGPTILLASAGTTFVLAILIRATGP